MNVDVLEEVVMNITLTGDEGVGVRGEGVAQVFAKMLCRVFMCARALLCLFYVMNVQ